MAVSSRVVSAWWGWAPVMTTAVPVLPGWAATRSSSWPTTGVWAWAGSSSSIRAGQVSSPAWWARAVTVSRCSSVALSIAVSHLRQDRVRAVTRVGGRVAAVGGWRLGWCAVGADSVRVERGDVSGGSGAVHRDAGGPGVAGDLGGDVPGQVGGVGGVSGQGDGEVFEVEQPRVAGVGGADGDQQRVRGGLSRFALPQARRCRRRRAAARCGRRRRCRSRGGAGRRGWPGARSRRWGRARRRSGRASPARCGPGPRRGRAGRRRRARRRRRRPTRSWPGSSPPGPAPVTGRAGCGRVCGGGTGRRVGGAAASTWTRPGRVRRSARRPARARGPDLAVVARRWQRGWCPALLGDVRRRRGARCGPGG